MFSMVAYFVIVTGLLILLVASISSLREGIRRRARLKGLLIVAGFGLLAAAGLVLIFI